MSRPVPQPDLDDEVIDIGPPSRRRWRRWLILAAVILIFMLLRSVSIYVEALWFESVGYASVYWYTFRLKLVLFVVFLLLTLVILRGAFWLLERVFAATAMERRTVMINNQNVTIDPGRFIRPVAWLVSILIAFITALSMSAEWEQFALYANQPATAVSDPIFHKPLGFYLFTLPVYKSVASWLMFLAFVILCASLAFTLLSIPQKIRNTRGTPEGMRRAGYAAVSGALFLFLLGLAWRIYLSRYNYLWQDHQSFSGVTYAEDNYLLPGLTITVIVILVSCALLMLNALTERRMRLILAALALPLVVYLFAALLIPAYVTSFIVKPNQLGRETPYIEHNIAGTRRAFGLDRIKMNDYEAQTTIAAFERDANRSTFENIRLWDVYALQDTLRQIQEIRTYYDFRDVDVDRYVINGEIRQMMIAAREIDDQKLPEQSRNWVNERLIYTHGYGVTMNTANGFTPEGMPVFALSNMPIESSVPEIKVTRPEIYFGQNTDTDVYVKTRQKEFNYPQGEDNNYSTYEGTGGITIGNGFRRMLLAWVMDDLSKLPFSDDVTPESRVLIYRNIMERAQKLAPFLVYDGDPYIVVSQDGRLFWMIDAFTESDNYPYSRHYVAGKRRVNYIRNSVKVVIDAYNGTTTFYVFDPEDPIINAYRNAFPALFRNSSEMPEDLRAHVRYPDLLIKTQGEVFGLYHTQNPKVFFQREDVWSVAQQLGMTSEGKQERLPIDPYYVVMQLPGQPQRNEFVGILPFTPSNRNNMIGWMAARSDGENYGSLLVYDFPKSRLIDGPLQIEARIDQNAQLSSQFSLWNQQGSKVRRGNLLVIPIGSGLLYVKPIYLQAAQSPMPELRLVVLATQERLAYGTNFEEALRNLFGDAASGQGQPQVADNRQNQGKQQTTENTQGSSQNAQQQQQAQPPANTQQLIKKAADDLAEYQRLTAEGKLGEAGQRLESLKRTLEELKRAQNIQ
ncbi:MAG TPA: UPF0182 family protein [Pyrinomonadaceae bacterium]|nr:UPF0182 family protein [Pyrinomonadaceae bacterium]